MGFTLVTIAAAAAAGKEKMREREGYMIVPVAAAPDPVVLRPSWRKNNNKLIESEKNSPSVWHPIPESIASILYCTHKNYFHIGQNKVQLSLPGQTVVRGCAGCSVEAKIEARSRNNCLL